MNHCREAELKPGLGGYAFWNQRFIHPVSSGKARHLLVENVAPLQGKRHGFAVPGVCMAGARLFTLHYVYPRPAKLLFTVDDGWNRYLGKHGDGVSLWTRLAVERMLACGTWPWA